MQHEGSLHFPLLEQKEKHMEKVSQQEEKNMAKGTKEKAHRQESSSTGNADSVENGVTRPNIARKTPTRFRQ
jgi:hypothetical protein